MNPYWCIVELTLSIIVVCMAINAWRWISRVSRISKEIKVSCSGFESALRQMWNPANLNNRPVEQINNVDYLEGYHDGQLNGYALAVREIARAFGLELEETDGND